ncbi:MAG: hypothetical protein ACTSWC_12900 [Promethearchaeota archaeon]|nr:hypothetical protein [Bacteroidota bacterium]
MSDWNTAWAWPWWSIMVTTSIANLIVSAVILKRNLSRNSILSTTSTTSAPSINSDLTYRRWMLLMGSIFTIVGAYRTVFVSQYGPQMAWFDSIANSSLLIRILAIFAEMSFSGLIAFVMLKFNTYLPASEDSPNPHTEKFKKFFLTKSPYVLVICIFLAQFFATSAVITKFTFLFAIEETLWSIGFLSVLPLAIIQLKRIIAVKDEETAQRLQMLKISAIVILGWCIIYCSYGLFYHLPGIWTREIAKLQVGYPEIKTGMSAIIDAFTIVHESKLYSDWGFGFLLWHSAYFSVCVWISIYLMQAPRPQESKSKIKIRSLQGRKLTTFLIIMAILAILAILTLISIPAFT